MNLSKTIGNIPITITAVVGTKTLTVSELQNLTVNSLVSLDQKAGSPVEIFANGEKIGTGEVVIINDNFGIRINEVVV